MSFEFIGAGFSDLVDTILAGEEFAIVLSLYLGMMATERAIAFLAGDRSRSALSDFCNIGVSTISAIVGALGLGALFVASYLFIFQFRFFDVPLSSGWAWLFVFAVHEFCYYLDHRLAHRIGFFWAFHQVHHASNHMDLTVAARGSIFDSQVQWTYWVIAPLLGISLPQLLVVRFFTNLFGIFNHTRLVHRLGFLENWLATPANHRVHHGRQPKYLDRNYGQVTVIFDRLFGTFQREEEQPDYGLVHRLEGYSPIQHHLVGFRWLWHQLVSAPTLADRLRYLIMPPGWSHTGSHQRAEDFLRIAAEADPATKVPSENGLASV